MPPRPPRSPGLKPNQHPQSPNHPPPGRPIAGPQGRSPAAPQARPTAGRLALNPSYGFKTPTLEDTQKTRLPKLEGTAKLEGTVQPFQNVSFEDYENEGTTVVTREEIDDQAVISGGHASSNEGDLQESTVIPTFALICPLLHSKIILKSEGTVIIGRSPSVEITLPAKKVSRKHAEIKFDGHGYSIHDLGSTNGTFVNGSRIHRRRRLRSGMKIDIGAFTFDVIELATADEDIDVHHGEDANQETVVNLGVDLAGSLEELSIAEVVQFIETIGKTGRLDFFEGSNNGVVWIEDGTVIHAEFGPDFGLKAAITLFGKQEGNFEFKRCKVQCPHSVMKATTWLLMEAARLADEAAMEKTDLD
jgi:pSer/pThr/pTyr-binding forkhead associated (FHA) protein